MAGTSTGSSSYVHVIAEAGTTHEGSVETALGCVDIAAEAGADSVKFQIIHAEGLYLPQVCEGGEQRPNPVFQQRRVQQLPDEAWARLAARARARGLDMSASVFDERGLDLLDVLDPPYIKVASCDLNHAALLRMVAERGRKMIVSTGMAELSEIERAVADVTATGHDDIVLMHCVCSYPAELASMNLGFITTLRSEFGYPVGLSDHTETSLAAAMAIALGATWIEKHFTYDRTAEGFDHSFATEPDQLAAFVVDVRAAQCACRVPLEKVGAAEAELKRRARRGVYAARAIPKGTTLAEADVIVRRPESDLDPNDLERLIGRNVRRDVRPYEALEWGLVT